MSTGNIKKVLFKPFLFILFLIPLFSVFIGAAEGGPCKDYGECDDFKYSLNDFESLQRGAATYINYCYGCHSLKLSLIHI